MDNNPRLIEYGGRKIAERPKTRCREMAIAIFDDIKFELAGALGKSIESVEKNRESFVIAYLQNSYDGYKIAAYLEKNFGWRCDSRVVQIIEEVSLDDIYKYFVKQWRDYWNVEPLFNVGDKVIYCGDEWTVKGVSPVWGDPCEYHLSKPDKDNKYFSEVIRSAPFEACTAVTS